MKTTITVGYITILEKLICGNWKQIRLNHCITWNHYNNSSHDEKIAISLAKQSIKIIVMQFEVERHWSQTNVVNFSTTQFLRLKIKTKNHNLGNCSKFFFFFQNTSIITFWIPDFSIKSGGNLCVKRKIQTYYFTVPIINLVQIVYYTQFLQSKVINVIKIRLLWVRNKCFHSTFVRFNKKRNYNPLINQRWLDSMCLRFRRWNFNILYTLFRHLLSPCPLSTVHCPLPPPWRIFL